MAKDIRDEFEYKRLKQLLDELPEDRQEAFSEYIEERIKDNMKDKRLTVNVREDIHRKFKLKVIENGTDMTTVLVDFIKEYVDWTDDDPDDDE